MRLNEIADPKHYITTGADLADYLERIGRIWLDSIGDDEAPFAPIPTRKYRAMPVER